LKPAFTLLVAIAATIAIPAMAQMRPQPGAGDPRIQTVMYDADQVVSLQVASGYELTVEFAPDERIENVAIGDSGAWQVTPNKRGDRLFLKPLQGATTNMTVVTDARSYVFELSPGSVGGAPFVVRFRYPPPPVPAYAGPAPVEPGRYKLAGSDDVRPDAISDDGSKTFILWRDSQTLPAVFVIDRDGKETLADGAMRDGRYVLDSVNNKLVFRLDKKMASATRVPQVAR
jgi:type IV secretion system protein VirB9